jgi:hypothetical protein
MYALRVSAFAVTPVAGITAFTFLGPIVVFVVAAIAVLLFALLSRVGVDVGDSERTTVLITPQPTSGPGVGMTPGPGFGLGSNPAPGQGQGQGPDRRPGQGTSAAAFGHRR